MRNRGLERDGIMPYVFLAPLLVLLVAFILYPVIMNLVASFTEWKGYGPMKWIGLANYRSMLADQAFWTSIRNTAILVCYIPLSVAVTVFVSALLREGLPVQKTLLQHVKKTIPEVRLLLPQGRAVAGKLGGWAAAAACEFLLQSVRGPHPLRGILRS